MQTLTEFFEDARKAKAESWKEKEKRYTNVMKAVSKRELERGENIPPELLAVIISGIFYSAEGKIMVGREMYDKLKDWGVE